MSTVINRLPSPLEIPGLVWHLISGYAESQPWTVVVALYGLARAFGVVIRSGQRGVLFRWGKAVKVLEPGYHWLVPLVHGVKKTPVRSVTIHLPGQKVMTADGLVYDVGVNVVYRVEDPIRALTLVDHVDSGCRAAIPMIVTEVIRVRGQTELADRVSLDRELSERVNGWIARWGLVVEQAGFTSIAPNTGVLRTTQLALRTVERARVLRQLIDGGLDDGSALVMIGTGRRLVAKASRGHVRVRRLVRAPGAVVQGKPGPVLPDKVPANDTSTQAGRHAVRGRRPARLGRWRLPDQPGTPDGANPRRHPRT
jgi:hypothetical protein